jgi:16S rRNA (cytosine967-C5)-methyltransferase
VTAKSGPAHHRLDARGAAIEVIQRVLFDQAYASAALNAEFLKYPQLSVRERAFATETVYTILRCRRALQRKLQEQTSRGLPDDRMVMSALYVAAAQLLLMDQVTPAVAVDACVTRVRQQRGSTLAGFANAVLRRLGTQSRLCRHDAMRENVPGWLRARLVVAVGNNEAEALVGIPPSSALGRPNNSIDVRVVSGRPLPDWLLAAEAGRWGAEARHVIRAGAPHSWSGWAQGAFVVQEQGAQLIGTALDVGPGAIVLDACAGRGNKTTQLAERVGPAGMVWAADCHPSKLDALKTELARLTLSNVRTVAVDWTVGGGAVPRDLKYVLVDAPCTGTGALARRPEILTRLEPSDPGRMGELGTQILRRVAEHMCRGGSLVYAVCSVLPEEAEQVLAQVADLFDPAPFATDSMRSAIGTGVCQGRLLPLRHGTDGYFVAALRRR